MKTLGNIIWLIFGGLETAIEYFVASLALMVTIVGVPFGLQTMKIGVLCLWPFGSKIKKSEHNMGKGCLNTAMNIIWIIFAGIGIAFTHVLFGIVFYITILGIPFGKQHFKMAHIALTPFGREIV